MFRESIPSARVLGGVMTALVIAVQDSVEPKNLEAATCTSTCLRSIVGSLLILLVAFGLSLRKEVRPATEDELPTHDAPLPLPEGVL